MRRLVLAVLALTLLPPVAAAAAATEVVAVPQAVDRACPATPGAAGTGVARFRAERDGIVDVVLRGGGEWDLAVLDGGGREQSGSAAFGGRERALGAVRAGDEVLALACRRGGGDPTAEVTFTLAPLAADPGAGTAQLVRVPLATPADLTRLEATGLDVTHAHDADHAEVVLYGAGDRARLERAGFTATTLVPDLRAADARSLLADAAAARTTRRSALPSGRTTYRTYAQYGEDLQALAAERPDLVRPVTIGESHLRQPIQGIEVAADVAREDDGRPVLALLGLHHAREWPSGEMPMELATDLVRNASDPRIARILASVRVLVLPVMNPDGFAVSRGAGQTPLDDQPFATLPASATDSAAYKRKNCRDAVTLADCTARVAALGVDLNRNYGAFWGGAGASATPTDLDYRGPGPFSEPESEAFHRLSQTTEVVNVVSHHTYTAEGTWLRQPGFCLNTDRAAETCDETLDVSPDEAGMKLLGDGFRAATGWLSELGWKIGVITGATEDWNYFAAGAYGYTPEQRGPNFHPDFASFVAAEYEGTKAGAAGGVREALLRAAEQAGDPAFHSVLTGTAPAGRTLRLRKAFTTETSQPGVVVDDRLDLTTRVRPDGTFTWHVNPSTRPLATAPEAYTLTCEDGAGTVLATRPVTVARGQQLALGAVCPAATGGDPAPPRDTGAPAGPPAPGGDGGGAGPLVRPVLRLTAAADRQRLRTVLRRGVLVRARCTAACTLRLTVRSGPRVVGVKTVRLRRAGRVVTRVRLSAAGRRALRRSGRRLTLTVTAPGARAARVTAALRR